MNIGLFSGSFNPIHKGHIALAEYIRNHAHIDEVWFVVSPRNPLKEDHLLIDEQHRLKMVELAIKGREGLKVSDVEMNMPKPSYTVNTLKKLSASYPEHRFHLIIGTDNMLSFHLWKDYHYILEHYPILVYPRDKEDIPAAYPSMQLIHAPLYPISSTQIREMIRHHEDISEWVAPEVMDYIQQMQLYID